MLGAAGCSKSTEPNTDMRNMAGTYTLVVAAPGYESAERTVDVQGSTPECGCASVQTQDLTFVLTPTP